MDADHAASEDHTTPPDDAWSDVLHATPQHDPLPGIAAAAVAHFGDPEGEARDLLESGAALVPLRAHGALRLVGGDRIDFLNGLVSHDVRGLATSEARLALLLDHRGRPRAGITVVRRVDDLYLAVDDGAAAVVREVLEAHVIFDDVRVQDLGRRIVAMTLVGASALAHLADVLSLTEPPSSGDGRVSQHPWRGADVLLHARPRGLPASVDVHLLSEHLPALLEALRPCGMRLVGERALAAVRVDRGLAAAAFEGAEALPQEAGLEGRVSYRKGCYLGQEIMARIEARGSLRRALARLRLDAEPGRHDEREVRDGSGRVVGQVGTVARSATGAWRALAVLRRDVDEGAALETLGVAARHEVWLA